MPSRHLCPHITPELINQTNAQVPASDNSISFAHVTVSRGTIGAWANNKLHRNALNQAGMAALAGWAARDAGEFLPLLSELTGAHIQVSQPLTYHDMDELYCLLDA